MPVFTHYTFFRWTIPVALSILVIIFTTHKSPDPILLSRYNYNFFALIISTGLLAGVCWWISLGQTRYRRLFTRITRLPFVSIGVIIVGTLALMDIFFDLIVIIAFFPVIIIPILVLLAAPIKPGKIGSLVSLPNLFEAQRTFALVIISIFVGIVIVEVIFRTVILEPKVPATEQQFTKLISSSWPRDISIDKPANSFRILGLSDSFGRAGGHQNYHYLLEDLLIKAGYNVEIVNISAVDYGPFDELEILKRFGVRYNPDLVLHGFYVGNDLGVPDTTVMTYLGIGVRAPQGYVAYRPRNFLAVQWIRSFITVQIDKVRRENEINAAPSKTQGVLSKMGFLNVERKFLKNFQVEPAPNRRWMGTLKNLDDIRKEANQAGALYVLVIHPDQIQFNVELRRELEQAFGKSLNQGYDFDLPQDFLNEYCLLWRISCLDLLATFEAQGAEGLFQPNDIHYSQNGNGLAAHTIFEFLQKERLVSE